MGESDAPESAGDDATADRSNDVDSGTDEADSGVLRTLAGPDADPLVAFAAGSVHAALVVVGLVGTVHAGGALGDVLGGFGTLPGAAAYLALWAVAWWTTRHALATAVDRGGGVPGALVAGLAWGAVAGVTFFLAVVLSVGLVLALSGPPEVVTVVLLVGIGSAVAGIVGSLVGGVLALLDVLLLGVATRVVESADGRSGGGSNQSDPGTET